MIDDLAATERCEAVLAHTSELRKALARLRGDVADPVLRDGMAHASEALSKLVAEPWLESLPPYGEVLRRLTRLWEAQGGPLDGFAITVGIIEQAVDGATFGAPTHAPGVLYEVLRRALPPPWQCCLDADAAGFAAALAAGPHGGAGGPEAAETPEQALQRELRGTFVAEADEGLAVCEEQLVQLEQRPDDRDVLDALFRQLHTLKGAAAAVDLPAVVAQLHSAETLLQTLRDGAAAVDGVVLVDFLLRLMDSVRGLIERGCGRTDSPYAVIDDVDLAIATLGNAAMPDVPAPSPGEAVLAKAAEVERPRDSVALGSQLHALAELRDRLGRGEGAGDIRQFIDALDQQARQLWDIASELKEQVNTLVLIPLDQLFRRLQRPARDAARQEGKLVTLEVSGGAIRIDHSIVERLHGPLLHLVRNAVSHGIEMPAIREQVGKHRTGTVGVHAEENGHDLVLVVEDDGRGLDLAAIRAKAVARGWLDAHELPEREVLVRMILRSGFSTKDTVTDLAGRGVGMDVVAREVEALHGVIDIESHDDAGTRVRLTIPIEKSATSASRSEPVLGSGTAAPRNLI